MYIIKEITTDKIIHINHAPLTQNLEGKEIYYKFDSKTMDIITSDLAEIPEHYTIKDNKLIELSIEEKVGKNLLQLAPDQKMVNGEIVKKTLSEQVKEGFIILLPQEKIIGEGDDEIFAEKTVAEKVRDGLIVLNPDEKIIGEGNEEQIVKKTIKEQIQEKIISLAELSKMIKTGAIQLSTNDIMDMVQDGVIAIDDYKKIKINEFSDMSFFIRDSILPDYKIQNALIGIYDETFVADVNATVEAFRNEFFRLENAILNAATVQEIVAIQENYPRDMVKASV
jgi:hypothetical protein